MLHLLLPHLPRFFVQTVAEGGIIESIQMCQFMCHKFLTFEFGEQLNFIIGMLHVLSMHKDHDVNIWLRSGHNGSSYINFIEFTSSYVLADPSITGGKSAILAAITVALGGNAIATGRGNGIKSLIREGQRWFQSEPSLV